VSLPQWDHMPSVAKLSLGFGKMMLLATFLLGAFIIHSVITEDVDDDDGPGQFNNRQKRLYSIY
jgi:hypothetical protein